MTCFIVGAILRLLQNKSVLFLGRNQAVGFISFPHQIRIVRLNPHLLNKMVRILSSIVSYNGRHV